MTTSINFEGILKIREIPADWDTATFQRWWPRMTERDKDRSLLWEGKNMLMNAGRTQMLTFMGQITTPQSFSQYYSVGTGSIYTIQPSDTTIAGELFRAQPASFSIVGNAVTVSTVFSTSQGNGTWTNAGIWGVNATPSLGSGVLMTHILCNFTKTSATAITSDYQMTLS